MSPAIDLVSFVSETAAALGCATREVSLSRKLLARTLRFLSLPASRSFPSSPFRAVVQPGRRCTLEKAEGDCPRPAATRDRSPSMGALVRPRGSLQARKLLPISAYPKVSRDTLRVFLAIRPRPDHLAWPSGAVGVRGLRCWREVPFIGLTGITNSRWENHLPLPNVADD